MLPKIITRKRIKQFLVLEPGDFSEEDSNDATKANGDGKTDERQLPF